ncbi:hypothetical protein GN958_ATG01410 [Phytophthora infestans]|uniref:Uncharacterized protein n=1 Tax=Phytophthora infestans TaxID=4787 RepID=A0A8S9VFL5_PHYIN|nr:hypothetical protein GN958_ATG01410 [Phytophthora infestans]
MPRTRHPASEERLEYVNLDIYCGNGRTWSVCKRCDQAYKNSSTVAMSSSRSNYEAGNDGRRLASGYDAVLRQLNPKRQKRIDAIWLEYHKKGDTKVLQRLVLEFEADNNLSGSFIEWQSTARLLRHANKMSGSVDPLPRRKTLGGPILDEYALAFDTRDYLTLRKSQSNTGDRANLLSDVWQIIARAQLLGCLMALFGFVFVYCLFATSSGHDSVAITEKMEGVTLNIQKDVRSSSKSIDPPLARHCFRKFFADRLNNLKKAALQPNYAQAINHASDTNASSTKWIVEVNVCIRDIYVYKLHVKQLYETRWNSTHGCFASPLKVRSALEMLEVKFRYTDDYYADLVVFSNRTFRASLADVEEVGLPLAHASLKHSHDENTIADVVVGYLDMNAGLAKHSFGSRNLIREVEKRWRQTLLRSDKAARLIDPKECRQLRDRDDRFECCEPEEDAGVESIVGPDAVLSTGSQCPVN